MLTLSSSATLAAITSCVTRITSRDAGSSTRSKGHSETAEQWCSWHTAPSSADDPLDLAMTHLVPHRTGLPCKSGNAIVHMLCTIRTRFSQCLDCRVTCCSPDHPLLTADP